MLLKILTILNHINTVYCVFVKELLLGYNLNQSLLHIVFSSSSYSLSLASLKLIGEQCFHFDDQAVNFLSLRILPVSQKVLSSLNERIISGHDEQALRLSIEITWLLSNLYQAKVDVWKLALTTGVVDCLFNLYHIHESISIRYEVLYTLVTFTNKKPLESLQSHLRGLITILISCLQATDP